MVRRALVALFCLTLVASGCSKSTSGSGTESKAKTYSVQVDAKKAGQAFALYAIAYYPAELSVHPGDTINFVNNFSGEPHSVTFGTIVDAGLAKVQPNAQEEPAELKQLPAMLPDKPTDPIPQNAIGPCYLKTGAPAGTAACTADQQRKPDFDGTYSYYNSGFLSPDISSFKVKLSDTISAGTYSYFCLLHRAAMSAKIKVVPAAETIPAPAAIDADTQKSIADVVSTLQPIVQGATSSAKAGVVKAGLGPPDKPIEATEFAPKEISVAAGGTVSWDVVGPHTVTFSPPADAGTVATKKADGTWEYNIKAMGPAGGPGFQGQPGTKATVDAGAWDGQGFHNSGFLPGFGPPGTLTYTIKFTQAGSYTYSCIIHPGMVGTVKVT